MKKSIKLLIFDLDGTLIDSHEDIVSTVNTTLSFFGVDGLTPLEIRNSIGIGIFNLVLKKLVAKGIYQTDLAAKIYSDNYRKCMLEKTSVYHGVIEVLEELKAYPKIVLTNKSNEFVRPILRQLNLENYFVNIYGKESFFKNKPDPYPVLKIAEEFGVHSEEILIIGDSDIDIQAGKQANSWAIGVSYGYGDLERMRHEKADFIVHHPREILNLLR